MILLCIIFVIKFGRCLWKNHKLELKRINIKKLKKLKFYNLIYIKLEINLNLFIN